MSDGRVSLLTVADVARKLRRSESHTAQRIVCRADFPKRRRLDGRGHPVWLESDVDRWILAYYVEDREAA